MIEKPKDFMEDFSYWNNFNGKWYYLWCTDIVKKPIEGINQKI